MSVRVLVIGGLLLAGGALAHAEIGLWALGAFPRLAAHKRRVQFALAALALLGPVTRVTVAAIHADWFRVFFAAAMTEYMVVMIAALPIAWLRMTTALAARLRARFGAPLAAPPGARPAARASDATNVSPTMTRRQWVEGVGGSVVLASSGSAIAWGAAYGRHAFVIEEVPVRVVGLPTALDGYTIGQISDLHVGVSFGDRELREGLSLLAQVKADLVVCTGDLVDFDPAYIPLMTRALASIRARDGVVAILGNHDYYTGAREVTDATRAAGIDVLVNDGRVVRAGDGGGFALLGVDDLWAAHYGAAGPRLDLALGAVPAALPRVLLSHQPVSVDAWAGRVALQLSGHTHGGQINPGFRPADAFMRYVSGRYEVGGTTLWVNRGFGVAGPPVRIGAPPEITKIVLVAA